MEDYGRAEQSLHLVPVERKKAEVDHTLPGKTPSGQTLNRWTRHGMTSVSRQWMEMCEKTGLRNVLVTARTKVQGNPRWVPGLRIDPLRLLVGCRKRRLNQKPLNLRGLI